MGAEFNVMNVVMATVDGGGMIQSEDVLMRPFHLRQCQGVMLQLCLRPG